MPPGPNTNEVIFSSVPLVALSADPRWHADRPDEIFEFRQRVIGAIWPDEFDELRRAAYTLAILLSRAAKTFLEHSEPVNNMLMPFKFYKRGGINPNYSVDVERYKECHRLIREATKAANWFADVVRRDFNPMFFIEKGRFIVEEGPFDDLEYATALLKFTDAETQKLPGEIIDS